MLKKTKVKYVRSNVDQSRSSSKKRVNLQYAENDAKQEIKEFLSQNHKGYYGIHAT